MKLTKKLNALKEENIRLKGAIKRRTVELEIKNRNLAVEESLERVRAQAMCMTKSEELLGVCQSVFRELRRLGLEVAELRNTQIVINHDEKGQYTGYQYSDDVGGEITEVPYNTHPIIKKLNQKLRKASDSFADIAISGKELAAWKDFVNHFPQKRDKKLNKATELHYYFYSVGVGALGISSFRSLDNEKLKLLQRFRNVFSLSYQRYVDIAQAETQARESRVELALERVRARTMAMQKSEELKEVVNLVYQQFDQLNITNTSTDIEIGLIDEQTGIATMWASAFNSNSAFSKFDMPLNKFPILRNELKIYRQTPPSERKNLLITNTYKGKEWNTFLKVLAVVKDRFAPLRKGKVKQWVTHNAYFSHGFITLQGVSAYQAEQVNVVARFAQLFEQTYTRFLDLQKAEVQAHHARIELALERVRARTMAMQKSEELSETVFVLHQQFRELGENPIQMHIGIYDEGERVIDFHVTDWADSGKQINNTFYLSIDEPTLLKKAFEGWKARKKSMVIDLTGKELQGWLKYRNAHTGVKVSRKQTGGGRVVSLAFFSNGHISISSPQPRPTETIQLLERFANVFDLTYTRFLDLKNAEAQAREAKIEAALERVRSRAMAMHKTDELLDAGERLYHELIGLGITSLSVTYSIVADDGKSAFYYGINPVDGKMPAKPFVFLHTETEVMKSIFRSWKKQEPVHTIELNEEGTLRHQTYIGQQILASIKENNLMVPFSVDAFLEVSPKKAFINTFNFSQGYIFMIGGEPLTANQLQILLRFTKVFELTYRRFLDLQNAEAQAREAQIEAALERVRSRSLAMRHSGELEQVAGSLFDRLTELGLSFDGALIFIFNKEKRNISLWIATNHLAATVKIDLPHDKSIENNVIIKDLWHAIETGEHMINRSYSGEGKNEYFRYVAKYNESKIPESVRQLQIEKERWTVHIATERNSMIGFDSWSGHVTTEEDFKILVRFAKVFEQAYTRFLDLQTAEAQAREATIETVLEKIRSRSLAMHQSNELQEVVNTVFERVKDLHIEMDTALIYIFNEGSRDVDQWIASPVQHRASVFHLPYVDVGILKDIITSKENDVSLLNKSYSFEEKNAMFRYAFEHTDYKFLGEERKKFISEAKGISVATSFSKNSAVQISRYTEKMFSEGETEILQRISKVFEQAYIRFLDLQNAEAQAREAKIEAALEKVRSRTMAMHHSDELLEVITVVSEQLQNLNFKFDNVSFGINNGSLDFHFWLATFGQQWPVEIHAPYIDNPAPNRAIEAQKKGIYFFTDVLTKEENRRWVQHLLDNTHLNNLPQKIKDYLLNSEGFARSTAVLKNIQMYIGNYTPLPYTEEENNIFKRFALVFEQAYTRFLDLQKAETQAREAQIEASLERVRSKTIAMHDSKDVGDTIATLFDELVKLGVKTNRCGILIYANSEVNEVWTAKSEPSGEVKLIIGYFNPKIHAMMTGARQAWMSSQPDYYYEMIGSDLKNYYQAIDKEPGYKARFNLASLPSREVHSEFFFAEGAVFAFTPEPLRPEASQIFKRFANVFGQTYRRYLDLQKAEAQAREATIEASLERVRGKAMAMHNSNDLIATAGVLFAELRKLRINSIRCGVGLLTKENRKIKLYSAATSEQTDNLPVVGWALLEGHEVLTGMYERWLRKENYFPILKGESLKSYYEKINTTFTVPVEQTEQYEQYGYFLPFSEGLFYGWSEKAYNEDEVKILHRFKAIVDLTFRRYMELQKSEEIASEAVRQASLDRVRAEIASMRTKNDLDRITPLIWNELTILGIPFVRCGVFIIDQASEQIHIFLSTPEGKAIAAFHLPVTSAIFTDAVEHWREKKIYVAHWVDKEFSALADILVDQAAIVTREQYLNAVPKEGIYLHYLPFLQGMLYVGNTCSLNEGDLHLVQSVADAFSTAYARYEDFSRLEAAKQQVEKTLVDLKLTQAQLVQSEKMASLGELTAGIAHEIQNPLNFVNNFSEVSTELVDEMNSELATGNLELATEIAKDLKQNLEKINHHGKRAGDIVKGMLQHSRSSSGVKEPTDINALADEYLRLAYHGLRAKDKTFNAKFETDLDPSIEAVSVIPQDIGRVVLNLITNAFYAVNEKKKSTAADRQFEPRVIVSTKKVGGHLVISVTDNGHGIPQKVLDKIFQPFFTTKPTGQGTGLGLSLSYDIVKAHGGELKVETKEGEGSKFSIQLSI